MTWLHRINPTPAFPAYTGPYKVGSVDVEIPASQLDSPSESPPPSKDVTTVAFRVFYPAKDDSTQKGVRWIPNPQREYLGAYARFLGAGNAFSQLFSALPQLLYYITIPVHASAELLEPTTASKRWPVMMFSHGLGGSKNAYSHICGSMASHGMVVVAPDHRDGSSPVSFVHAPEEKDKRRRIEYRKVPHKASTEVYEARDEQLKIRLWELGLVHDALLKLDAGAALENVSDEHSRHSNINVLGSFTQKLDIDRPGTITLAGHSFGAATMVQFAKSVYYRPSSPMSTYTPLFAPSAASSLVRQITPSTPILLLDLWTLPIQSPSTTWLRSQPMPSYQSPAGGSPLLAILSEAFYNWSSNLADTKRILAPPRPLGSSHPSPRGPHIFYPTASAHLSQSDFGVLLPWITTKIFGAKEPERVLRLNARAMLQVLRNSGVQVANTSAKDLELNAAVGQAKGVPQDDTILSTAHAAVRGWISLSTDTDTDTDTDTHPASNASNKVDMGPSDAVVEGEVLGQVVSEQQRDGVKA